MAPSLEIGNALAQSPRISFTQMETKRSTNYWPWESSTIPSSLNISETHRISREKRKIDVADVNYDIGFEFCHVNRIPVTDELFVDRKILPPIHIHSPIEARPVPIACLESLRCLSPVRSTSSRSAEIRSSCSENVESSKSFRDHNKPPNKWNEMVFQLSNNENGCAKIRSNSTTSCKVVDQSGDNLKQQPSSKKSMWSFSRSCRTVGGEMKGNSLLRFLPFSRSRSTATAVEGPKYPEAWSISNKVQPDRQYYGELKPPRFETEESKEKTKAKQSRAGRGKLGSRPGVPESRMRRVMSSRQSSTGRVGENGRLIQVRYMDSPPPGKPMADGFLLLKANNYMGGGMKVSPVVNVPVCNAHQRGSFNGGGGLFGFFSKSKRKEAQSSARHHSHASTNKKKGT